MFRNLARLGYYPDHVIDIGAASGQWSRDIRTIFPKAAFHLYEPNPFYNIPDFDNVHKLAVGYAKYLYIPAIPQQASILPIKHANKIKIKSVPLSNILSELEGHIILKLDTQGTELDILKSAGSCIKAADVIFIETSLVQIIPGQDIPLFADVVHYMDKNGFQTYDINHRHVDANGRVMQLDVTFVNMRSRLWPVGHSTWGYFSGN